MKEQTPVGAKKKWNGKEEMNQDTMRTNDRDFISCANSSQLAVAAWGAGVEGLHGQFQVP